MTDINPLNEQTVKKTRKRNPEKYEDCCRMRRANSGDVVYMPSNPELKMTVDRVLHYNYTADNDAPKVSVQWISPATGEILEKEVYARTLVKYVDK